MAAPEPDTTWIGSPNFGYPQGTRGRNGYTPIAIVYHVMDGSLAGTDSWFSTPDSQVSAHFGIGETGEIHQYVLTSDAAWANGTVRNPTWKARIAGENPNLYTLSIEHEGRHVRDANGNIISFWEPTEAQYQASLALTRWLIEKYHIPVDADHLIPHSSIDSVDRAFCPGPGFPFDRLIADAASSEAPPPGWDPATEIQRLKDRGIINSDHDPGDPVNWGQLATVLNRILDRG